MVRLKVPRHAEVRFEDIIRGWVVPTSTTIRCSSRATDSRPITNIVDDHLMRITHVMGKNGCRAPPHVLIYEAFGWGAPCLAHPAAHSGSPMAMASSANGTGDGWDSPCFSLDWVDPTSKERAADTGKGLTP